ncbi:hypothetical protein KQI65_14405 [bacterium]|nr:hypothetical protein [bacterium]
MTRTTNIIRRLRAMFATLDAVQRQKAVDSIEWEYEEMRHVFALLVMGQSVGLPSPPPEITFALLPYMEDDLRLLLRRIDTASAPFSQLWSSLPME